MQYEDALKEWGARKLEAAGYYGGVPTGKTVARSSVVVKMDFTEGYVCCGGNDPDCYCSFAESPRAEVSITGTCKDGMYCHVTMEASDFDFVAVLEEIVVAGGGAISS